MQDDQQSQDEQQVDQQQTVPPQDGILNQTFGEVLQNKEAQERIMKAMHIGPEQFQQLLKSTEGNPLTNMTVGQLFNSGFVQQAVKAQGGKMPSMEQIPQQPASNPSASSGLSAVGEEGSIATSNVAEGNAEQIEGQVAQQDEHELDPEQFQQMVDSGNAQVLETDEMGNPTKIAVEQPQPELQKQQSWWEIIKSAFK